MGCNRLRPVRRHLGDMREKRLFPDQADGQKVDDRHVGFALKLGLPQHPARVLRPAARIHQQPVKDRLGGAFGQAQPVGRPQDHALRRVIGPGHVPAKAG